ncbi:MAG: Vitamin B12 ABC transporter, permease protein BtuC [Cytophagales bacterium]|jgi:iron complex transport system permease protein|nr:iron ABC transporter permease [Bacteroidota bacterium]MBS1981169.1 iron ABC transporter permease [Bacteroidota bacterium]WHZ06593.1 MAG: Vitamin B12 ABC transporter, permease protein BtuC [Cytophagales bacterium]
MNARPLAIRFFVLGFFLLCLFLTDIVLGGVSIPLPEIIKAFFNSSHPTWHTLVWQFRLPRAITCVLAGASLSSAGLLMQTLFRNPLAGPDVLGLSSGAGLAVGLVVLAGKNFLLISTAWSLAFAAGLGSVAVLLVMLLIARTIRDNASLLIIGLMIAAATSSLMSLLQFLSKAEDLQFYFLWTMGSVSNVSWSEIEVMVFVFLISGLICLALLKPLNGWLLGENYARSLGIDVGRSRLLIVVAAGLLTGVVTAFCGPIAFVGLAVPHLARLVMQTTNHKLLIPAVMAGGAILLLFCDVITQATSGVQSIPLNAVTSIIGAPIVIWQVMRFKKISV